MLSAESSKEEINLRSPISLTKAYDLARGLKTKLGD